MSSKWTSRRLKACMGFQIQLTLHFCWLYNLLKASRGSVAVRRPPLAFIWFLTPKSLPDLQVKLGICLHIGIGHVYSRVALMSHKGEVPGVTDTVNFLEHMISVLFRESCFSLLLLLLQNETMYFSVGCFSYHFKFNNAACFTWSCSFSEQQKLYDIIWVE